MQDGTALFDKGLVRRSIYVVVRGCDFAAWKAIG